MIFALQFRNKPEKSHLIPGLMDAHRAFLKKHEAVIYVAGSLRQETDDAPIGGLWLVNAPGFAEAKTFYLEDPFWTAGLRASVEIHRLAKAFPEVEKPV